MREKARIFQPRHHNVYVVLQAPLGLSVWAFRFLAAEQTPCSQQEARYPLVHWFGEHPRAVLLRDCSCKF